MMSNFSHKLDAILETKAIGQLAFHFADRGELSVGELKELIRQGWLSPSDVEELLEKHGDNPEHPLSQLNLPAPEILKYGSFGEWRTEVGEAAAADLLHHSEAVFQRVVKRIKKARTPGELRKVSVDISELSDMPGNSGRRPGLMGGRMMDDRLDYVANELHEPTT